MKNITYTAKEGILYPDLALPEQPTTSIGKYGRMRLDYLKAHRRGTYTTLLTTGTLAAHLSDIDREARSMVEKTTAGLAKERGIDESLKASDPLRWTQEMNNCKATAEEIAIREVIYQ